MNVSKLFKHEPAPIGIADYGVDAAGNPTSFFTPVLLGIVHLTPMVAWNMSLASPDSVNFALNGNLNFAVGSTSYVYQVSDVLQYSTRGGNAQFLDQVWNASTTGARLISNSVSGHCGLTSSSLGTYYSCLANSSLPGNGYFIPLPAEIEIQLTSLVVHAVPAVSFAFNDGFGWLTMETVTFPFAAGATDAGFVVDGGAYRPDGKYLDAELSLGAPAPGDDTHANRSNVQLQLEYWNGHNLQEPTSTYNVASDSLDEISNVSTSVVTVPSSGNLSANVVAGGGGALGVLWNRSNVGEVNLSTSVPSGQLVINGTSAIGFVGGAANLTLAPGSYTLSVYNQSLFEGEIPVTVTPGAYLAVHVAWRDVYSVGFAETGLPYVTTWSVTVDNVSLETTSAQISCLLPTGPHAYVVDPLAGFMATPSGGPIDVATSNLSIAVSWSVEQFSLDFVPRGLPTGTTWSVTIGGFTRSAIGIPIEFTEPPATYVFAVVGIAGLHASPAYGSVMVTTANVTVNVTWTAFTFPIAFEATGLPSAASWGLAVLSGGVWLNSTGSDPVVTVPLANGSFTYAVTPPSGFVAASPEGQSTVRGAGFAVPIVFRGADGFIVGTISPSGASVWVDNVSIPVVAGAFNVSVPPGPHDVRASAGGFSSMEAVVEVVSERPTLLNWTLAAEPTGAGLSGAPLEYAGLAAGALVVAAIVVVALRRRRRPPSWEPLEGTQTPD